ncbi:MAG: Hsp20/alpha crystallin family protein [Bacteroidetes bacterium]|nr:MAG: Hsp20/alpha crystallin family protein [Bacteroidota bacterium]
MTLLKRNNWLNGPSFFDDFFGRDFFDWSSRNFAAEGQSLPAVNILETNDAFKVELAAPGLKKDDFKVKLENNLLTISVEKGEEESLPEGVHYNRREFFYHNFQRSFQLSTDVVDVEHIEARYEDGILYLTIPKREEAKTLPPRMIEIA